tara:strand:- start:1196 stop:1564 length:369 start_codon:yes stop_codon:yes gene_type:complete
MPLEERDLSYLLDMLTCCRDVEEFISGVTFEEFARDKMRRLATERQLETLGEAANHVSIATQELLNEIEWRKIVGLRNKLAHDYGEILAQRVWLIAIGSIPKLRSQLLAIPDVTEADSSTSE